MNILVTGGAGFLGKRLVKALLSSNDAQDGRPAGNIERIIVVDREPTEELSDPRIEQRPGDIADPAFLSSTIADGADIIYHLAAVVSGEAEANFDLGMRVNVDASRSLLEACRSMRSRPRVVFTSSVAVFGPTAGDAEPLVDPRSSYGTEKAIAELLLQDYSRRGFVDGVVLRLPTISVRPGRPNKAASSFASGIIREPLQGIASECPVDPVTRLWLMSPRKAVAALVRAGGLAEEDLRGHRIVNLPGVSVSVEEMLAVLGRRSPEARVLVEVKLDRAIGDIVTNWPARWDCDRAVRLGFEGDRDFEAIVDAFVEDDLDRT